MRIVHLSKERVISFIFFLDFLLSPLFNTVTHVRLEPEAECYHRVSNAAGRQILICEDIGEHCCGLTSEQRMACRGRDEMEGSWCQSGVCIPSVSQQPRYRRRVARGILLVGIFPSLKKRKS